jgi:hypothetical protein
LPCSKKKKQVRFLAKEISTSQRMKRRYSTTCVFTKKAGERGRGAFIVVFSTNKVQPSEVADTVLPFNAVKTKEPNQQKEKVNPPLPAVLLRDVDCFSPSPLALSLTVLFRISLRGRCSHVVGAATNKHKSEDTPKREARVTEKKKHGPFALHSYRSVTPHLLFFVSHEEKDLLKREDGGTQTTRGTRQRERETSQRWNKDKEINKKEDAASQNGSTGNSRQQQQKVSSITR